MRRPWRVCQPSWIRARVLSREHHQVVVVGAKRSPRREKRANLARATLRATATATLCGHGACRLSPTAVQIGRISLVFCGFRLFYCRFHFPCSIFFVFCVYFFTKSIALLFASLEIVFFVLFFEQFLARQEILTEVAGLCKHFHPFVLGD